MNIRKITSSIHNRLSAPIRSQNLAVIGNYTLGHFMRLYVDLVDSRAMQAYAFGLSFRMLSGCPGLSWWIIW